ncbi:AEC family transporter [Alteribacter natronophilus]|uniref:AEC family transporter n=1 Tax=Alteribacter natronophilus TaxID=2583810 RepID=UPI00110EAD7F|nr:AEC family transporter [Alteribacter natronophilus]TMW71799.1 AEC family transporter [Alteribacter natronophilus]
MEIFLSVVLPVICVFAIGFAVQKWQKLDLKPLSAVAVYVMTPALVFRTFYESEMDMQYVYMVIFCIILLFALIIINKIYARLMGYSSSLESGLILSTAFMNAGNYGAPIILFAYGEMAFAYAVSFLVFQSIIMNFFGVYYAARGGTGIKVAVKAVLTMPATYAFIVALVMKSADLAMPGNMFRTVDIIADATIPTVMIILGMQLARIERSSFEWGKISYATILRLIISPVIAWLITLVLPVNEVLADTLIVLAAMPSAAMMVIYSVQFDTKPKLVSSITFISTIVSVFTLTVLLIILG